jgi:hypothetical protein
LAGLLSWWDLLWCIEGNFNIIHYPSERSSDTRSSPAMLNFSEFILEQGLKDTPLVGGNFTWSNIWDRLLWSKIDRFLLSPGWEAEFPNVFQRRLPRLLSDNFPLMLDCGDVRSRRYFKFENMWLKSDGSVDKVKHWWASYRFQGSPSFV